MIEHTIKPYLPGFNFDRVVVKITDDGWVFVYCCELDESTTLRFYSSHYKPAAGQSEEGQVADVISFAMAYVERPEEFDRAGCLEQEPENRAWWLAHGDNLSCEVDEESEGEAPKKGWGVTWDNGASACGSFPDVFDSYEDAKAFGEDWANECNARDGIDTEVEDGYTFDIFRIGPDDDENED